MLLNDTILVHSKLKQSFYFVRLYLLQFVFKWTIVMKKVLYLLKVIEKNKCVLREPEKTFGRMKRIGTMSLPVKKGVNEGWREAE